IGTGHGEREWSPAGQTRFERAGRPVQITQLRYDAPAALSARGILPRERPWSRHTRPQAFPGGFVPDPPRRWRCDAVAELGDVLHEMSGQPMTGTTQRL